MVNLAWLFPYPTILQITTMWRLNLASVDSFVADTWNKEPVPKLTDKPHNRVENAQSRCKAMIDD